VARVWTAYAHQNVVFTGKIECDVSFTFAAVLAANQNVYKALPS
jgi:hypothetical protein